MRTFNFLLSRTSFWAFSGLVVIADVYGVVTNVFVFFLFSKKHNLTTSLKMTFSFNLEEKNTTTGVFFFAKTYPGYAHFCLKNKTKKQLWRGKRRNKQRIKIIFIVLTKKKCPKMLHKQQNSQICLSNLRGSSKQKILKKT